jgi:hypothetical protein
LAILDLMAKFRRAYVELCPAAISRAGVIDSNANPSDVLLRAHAAAHAAVVIKAEQFLARFDVHGESFAIGLDPKKVGATLRDDEARIAVRIVFEYIRPTRQPRQDQGSNCAIVAIAEVCPQFRHHSVKLTN